MQSIKCGGYNLLFRYFFLCCWLLSLKLIHKRNDYFLYSILKEIEFQPSMMLSRGNSAPWELPPVCYYISLSSTHWSQNLINLTTILGFLCVHVHGPTAQLTYSAYLSSQQIYLKFKKKQRGFWIIFLQKRGSKNWLQFKLGHWMLGTLGVNHGLDVFGYASPCKQRVHAHFLLLLNIWFDCFSSTHIWQVNTGLPCPLWALRIFCTYNSDSVSRSSSWSFCCVFPMPWNLKVELL